MDQATLFEAAGVSSELPRMTFGDLVDGVVRDAFEAFAGGPPTRATIEAMADGSRDAEAVGGELYRVLDLVAQFLVLEVEVCAADDLLDEDGLFRYLAYLGAFDLVCNATERIADPDPCPQDAQLALMVDMVQHRAQGGCSRCSRRPRTP